jgi:hypothetical protein
LEFWNYGTLEYWVMVNWGIGLLVRSYVSENLIHKEVNKWEISSLNHHSNIPPFHYSICEAKDKGLKKYF